MKNRNRKRDYLVHPPHFNLEVRTNIGKIFFKLLTKHFPKTSNRHKIFNSNTVKLSYCCSNNLDSIIKKNNIGKFNSLHVHVESHQCKYHFNPMKSKKDKTSHTKPFPLCHRFSYIVFSITHGFRHPLVVLEDAPKDNGD